MDRPAARGIMTRMRGLQPWQLRSRKDGKAETWKRLLERDPAAVSALCDHIVRVRPVPDRLLMRLGITTRGEKRAESS